MARTAGQGTDPASLEPLAVPRCWCYLPGVMPGRPDLEFRILGPIEVSNGTGLLALGGPKQRALLADLILNAGTVVSTARLIDDLWGDDPPQTADHTVETYVSRLRRVLRDGTGPDVLLTRSPGYVLDVASALVDALRFERLLEEGSAAALRGDDIEASKLLREALGLWRGDALADIVSDASFAEGASRHLDERRLHALELRNQSDLELGRARDLIAELERLVAAHPYREAFHAQLMLALYRSGRQTEALAAYRRARNVLVEELGIEPGTQLRDLEQAILRHDPSLDSAPPREPAVSGPPPTALDTERDEPPPSRTGRRRRRMLVAAGTALTLIAVVVPLSLRHSANRVTVPLNGIGVLSVSGTSVAAALPLPSAIDSLATGAGSLWATSPEGHVVFRINPLTHGVTQTVPVGSGPEGIALDDGAAWVANSLDGTVSRVDTSTGNVVQTIGAGSQPTEVAAGDGAIWVTDPVASAVYRIDPTSGRLVRSISLTSGPFGVALGAGSVWVTEPSDDGVTRIDPVSGEPVERISVGADPSSIVFGFGSLWVANSGDSTVSRIDPEQGRVLATIPVGDGPAALAIGATGVWVADATAGTVDRIDPQAGHSISSLQVGNRPSAAAVIGGAPWIGVRPSTAEIHRGGTLRLLTTSPFESNDPATSYPTGGALGWAMFDTLVTFQHVGGSAGAELVPDLAVAIPTPLKGGTEYTFVLRPGLRYSNGDQVRPEDVRYGLERVFDLNSTERSFFFGIVGADRCLSRSPCDLSQGITVDNHVRAVTFHLTEPDANFLYKLAAFSVPVPAGVPAHDMGMTPVPGTGPYMIGRIVPNKEVDLVRNPEFREWSAAAQPEGFPDRIVWAFGLSPNEEVAAIEGGRADWTDDPLPDVSGLVARFPRQVHVSPIPGTASIAFNVTVPPFNDIRVRRAVSFVADRRTAVRVFGGPDVARPTCQILPPGLPGYHPYCPYTVDPGPGRAWIGPDVARARGLVTASRTTGMRVVVWAHRFDAALGRYAISVLRVLGYRASLHLATALSFSRNVNDTRRRIQATASEWIVDFPSASDIFDLFYRCSTFIPADPADTRSSLFFCNPRIDRQMDEADRLQISDPRGADKVWASVDHEITNLALSVPFVSLRNLDFTSARVGDYQFSPDLGTLIDQFWVR
jgi:YVTN family beta-propeller protein